MIRKTYTFIKDGLDVSNISSRKYRIQPQELEDTLQSSELNISDEQSSKAYKKISQSLDQLDADKTAFLPERDNWKLRKTAAAMAAGIMLAAGAFLYYSNSKPPEQEIQADSGRQINLSLAIADITSTPDMMIENEIQKLEQDIMSGIDFLQSFMPKGVNESNNSKDSET